MTLGEAGFEIPRYILVKRVSMIVLELAKHSDFDAIVKTIAVGEDPSENGWQPPSLHAICSTEEFQRLSRSLIEKALIKLAPRAGCTQRKPDSLRPVLLRFTDAVHSALPSFESTMTEDIARLGAALLPITPETVLSGEPIDALATLRGLPDTSILYELLRAPVGIALLELVQSEIDEHSKSGAQRSLVANFQRAVADLSAYADFEPAALMSKSAAVEGTIGPAATYVNKLTGDAVEVQSFVACLNQLVAWVRKIVDFADLCVWRCVEDVASAWRKDSLPDFTSLDTVYATVTRACAQLAANRKAFSIHGQDECESCSAMVASLGIRGVLRGILCKIVQSFMDYKQDKMEENEHVTQVVELYKQLRAEEHKCIGKSVALSTIAVSGIAKFKHLFNVELSGSQLYRDACAAFKGPVVSHSRALIANADSGAAIPAATADIRQHITGATFELQQLAQWAGDEVNERTYIGETSKVVDLIAQAETIIAWTNERQALGDQSSTALLKQAYKSAQDLIYEKSLEHALPLLVWLMGDRGEALALHTVLVSISNKVVMYSKAYFAKAEATLLPSLDKLKKCLFDDSCDVEFLKAVNIEKLNQCYTQLRSKLQSLKQAGKDFAFNVDELEMMSRIKEIESAARLQINKYALLTLLHRPGLRDPAKGKLFRAQLVKLWGGIPEAVRELLQEYATVVDEAFGNLPSL